MDMSSTTMPLTLSKRLNMFFIRRFLWFFFLVEKQTHRKRPSHPHNQRLNDETTPTKTTQEPENSVHIVDANLQKHSSEGSLFVKG